MAKLSPLFVVVEPGPYQVEPALPYSIKLLRFYLNWGYYLVLIPYRVSWNDAKGFFIQRNIVQTVQVLCFLAHTCIFLSIIAGWKGVKTRDPDQPWMFSALLYILGNSSVACFIWTMWTRASAFRRFFENVATESFKHLWMDSDFVGGTSDSTITEHKNLRSKLLSLYSLTKWKMVAMTSFGIILLLFLTIVSTYDFLKIFLSTKVPSMSTKIFFIFTLCYLLLMAHFFDLFLLILTLLVSQRVDVFVDSVMNNFVPADKVLDCYYNLKTYVRKVNDSFGLWVIVCTLAGLPFYVMELTKIILPGETALRPFLIIFYLIFYMFCLIIASDTNVKVEKVKDWLAMDGNLMKIPQQQLTLLLHELGSDSIGLKGGKYFTISYSLVGSVASLVVTYTIIALQWNN